jgi:hypothetical protein
MHNPTIDMLIMQARTEDLRRAAQQFRGQRLATPASRGIHRRRTPRSASMRRATQYFKRTATGKTAAVSSRQQ